MLKSMSKLILMGACKEKFASRREEEPISEYLMWVESESYRPASRAFPTCAIGLLYRNRKVGVVLQPCRSYVNVRRTLSGCDWSKDNSAGSLIKNLRVMELGASRGTQQSGTQ